MSRTHRNAIALLRAATCRRAGYRMWEATPARGRMSIASPSQHHLGWFAFSWHDGSGRRTVDLARHRSIAKAQVRTALD